MNFILSLLGGSSVQIYIYLAVLFAGFSGGFYVEHLRFVDFQDGIKIVAEKQIAENKAKEKEQELINRGVTDAYNANLSNVHNFYNRMLDTNSGAMSTNGTAAITINGETHNLLLVAEQCADTTTQLISLQDWINQQAGLDDARPFK